MTEIITTDIEKKLLKILAEHGVVIGSANLGFLLWPGSADGSDRRTPQGLAMAAGKVAKRLKENRLITAFGQPAVYKLAERY